MRQPRIKIAEDQRVLPDALLSTLKQPGPSSVYADPVWSLDEAIPLVWAPRDRRVIDIVKFEKTAGPAARPFAWCCLNFDLSHYPCNFKEVPPVGLNSAMYLFRRYVKFLAGRGATIEEASGAHYVAWAGKFSGMSTSHFSKAITIPQRVWMYRDYLPIDQRKLEPWRDDISLPSAPPRYRGENRTPRIPRTVLDPLMKWCRFYIESASRDILWVLEATKGSMEPRFGARLREYSVARLPVSDVPWIELKRGNAYKREIEYIVDAAWIIAAFFTGMRNSEEQELRGRCWSVHLDESGQPFRYFLQGTSTKIDGRTVVPKEWVTVALAVKALEKVAELNAMIDRIKPPALNMKNTDLLLRRHNGFSGDDAALTNRVTPRLRSFLANANRLGREALARCTNDEDRAAVRQFVFPDGPSGVGWKLSAAQFRRSVAYYIARQPYGVVAGAVQFGHLSAAIFQGYAGTEEGAFRDEVEKERAIGSQTDFIDMYNSVKEGRPLVGPKGRALEKQFRWIAEVCNDFPGQIVDEARVHQLLMNMVVTVYPGLLNDCLFERSTALCLIKHPEADGAEPLLDRCDREKCPNSCVSEKHRPMIEDAKERAVSYRRRRGLSSNQRSALDRTISRYERTLVDLDGPQDI